MTHEELLNHANMFKMLIEMNKEKLRKYNQYYRAYASYYDGLKCRNLEYIKNGRKSAYQKEFVEYSKLLPPFETNLSCNGNVFRYLQYYITNNLIIDVDSGIDKTWEILARIDANPFKLNTDVSSPEHPKNVERYEKYFKSIKIEKNDRLMSACEENDKLWESNNVLAESDEA
jgi:hypothetical protein